MNETMNPQIDEAWRGDLARYPARPFLKEQSIWAVWVYRFGRRVDRRSAGLCRRVLTGLYWLLFRGVETAVGISLPKEARIGPGLRIWHFGGIFVHPGTTMGRNCTLRQGVTLGNRVEGGPAPILGDDVEVGAYAQILGDVHIGHGARIGAMAVVLADVPDGATAVGAPARVIPRLGGRSTTAQQPRTGEAPRLIWTEHSWR